MANIVKKEIDTRTFAEICATLSQLEWLELKDRIHNKLGKSYQTYLNWRSGKTYPFSQSERREVSAVVNKFLGINTNPFNLFNYGNQSM